MYSPDHPVLDYGHRVEAYGFSCVSTRGGITCTNPRGHGFSVAKATQRVF